MATYCEYLFMGNPIEMEMSAKDAMKRFKSKMEALEKYKGTLVYEGSFVGVKDEKGKWLITNRGEEKLKEVI
jgi:hypothetical protein